MCLYPRLIKNKKYIPNKKNNFNPPIATDERVLYVPIGCGKCIECKNQRANEWRTRLLEEIRHEKNGKFITFTFDEESYRSIRNELIKQVKKGSIKKIWIDDNEIATYAVRRFLERWRKKYGKSVKHWFITEKGQENTKRIHIHGIIWCDVPRETISDLWKYGHIWIGDFVNEKTINYIVKYVSKVDKENKSFTGKVLTSRGIGKGYLKRHDAKLNEYNGIGTKEYYRDRAGFKRSLPIYYRNKIYTEEEREKLWINRIDKEERFVLGRRISVSENEDEYNYRLKLAQEKNKRLGYGDDKRSLEDVNRKNLRKAIKRAKELKKIKKI